MPFSSYRSASSSTSAPKFSPSSPSLYSPSASVMSPRTSKGYTLNLPDGPINVGWRGPNFDFHLSTQKEEEERNKPEPKPEPTDGAGVVTTDYDGEPEVIEKSTKHVRAQKVKNNSNNSSLKKDGDSQKKRNGKSAVKIPSLYTASLLTPEPSASCSFPPEKELEVLEEMEVKHPMESVVIAPQQRKKLVKKYSMSPSPPQPVSSESLPDAFDVEKTSVRGLNRNGSMSVSIGNPLLKGSTRSLAKPMSFRRLKEGADMNVLMSPASFSSLLFPSLEGQAGHNFSVNNSMDRIVEEDDS